MVRRFYELPSLTTLAVFEACARHLSFKLAAAELNVTPGAVSRQIKAIEDEMGVPLFVRHGSGVDLTGDGADLYAVLASGFSRASDVVRGIRRGNRSKNVTVACSDAFGTMWLIPNMPKFWEQHPDIQINHLISDDLREFRRSEVELKIIYGLGSWPDETVDELFGDVIYPVCGPAFAEAHRGVTPEDLPGLPLLHVDWVNPNWLTWDEYFTRANISHGPLDGRRFGKLFVTLQAAQANQGVAIGWDRLVGPLVDQGKLVRLTDLVMPANGAYYLTYSVNRVLSPAANLFRDWLMQTASKDIRPQPVSRPYNNRR